MGVYEVVEIESIIKIEVAQFLQALGPISVQNLCITRERGRGGRTGSGMFPLCFPSNFK